MKKKKGIEGESQKTLSWIWLAGEEQQSAQLWVFNINYTYCANLCLSAIWIKWLKACARKNWWTKEVYCKRK